jgi:hypothetical protein
LGAWPNAGFVRAFPVTIPADDRSSLAKAYHWATRIMAVSLEMVLPGVAGSWVDRQLGTKVLFMFLGFVLGGTAATVHLIRLTRSNNNQSEKNRPVDD